MSVQAAARILREIVVPVHEGLQLEFGVPSSPEAHCMSVACFYQESKGLTRDQGDDDVVGPATGYWQFEKNGGVAEILEHGRTGPIAAELCRRVGVAAERDPVWRLFNTASGDELACAFARLLVWKDRASLPAMTLEAEQEAYRYYDRNWRPGKKRPQDWPTSWSVARQLVGALQIETPAPRPPSPETPAAPPSHGLEARVAALETRLQAVEKRLVPVTVYGPGPVGP